MDWFRPRHRGPGHVESWFVRANHPDEPRALWLKSTLLHPRCGPPVAEAWVVLFDGDRTWGTRTTAPLAESVIHGGPVHLEIAGCTMDLAAEGGRARGALGDARWDLSWSPVTGPLGAPLHLYPRSAMLRARFPRSKLVTPHPAARFSGTLTWGDEPWNVDGWAGMHGHNWGREHAWRYAWGQVLFPGSDGEPHVMAEGFTGHLKVRGWETPGLSSLVVRRGSEEHRFDHVFHLWRSQGTLGELSWSLHARGPAGRAVLSLTASPARVAALDYANPDGSHAVCVNSKVSRAILRVSPVNREAFTCRSDHGGALELLSPAPDPRWPNPI